jgi:hypothetical protein
MRVHGWVAGSPGIHGRFHFAVICLLKAIEHAQAFAGRNKYPKLKPWLSEEARQFLLASGKLQDSFWKLNRAAELLDVARNKLGHIQPPSSTHTQVLGVQEAYRDIPLFIDNILIYLKIFADCLANCTSQFYERKDQVPRFSFRLQREWFIKKRASFDPRYAEILKNQTAWFTALAGGANEEGLRELVVHRMIGTQLFYRPGKVPDENQVQAFLYGNVGSSGGNLLPTIQKLVDDLCLFLDSYFDHYSKKLGVEMGGQLVSPSGTLLFEFEGHLPSAWLYPEIR